MTHQREGKALSKEPKKVLCGQVKWGREWRTEKRIPKKVIKCSLKVAIDDQFILVE